MNKTYAVLALIAAVVLGVYNVLPNRYFSESVFPLAAESSVIAYDDLTDGGSSSVEFNLQDSLLDFSCTLGGDSAKAAWCGLLFDLNKAGGEEALYRNWTFVDSVVFDMESYGTGEVLVKIWTFDPDVTDPKVAKTFRLLMKELPLTSGRQRVALPMEQFYTPDFWYKDAKVDTTLNRRHQETVARVEIAPGWNQPKGKKFGLKIYSVSAIGVSNLFFGIVLFIMVVLMIIAIGRRHSLHKNENGN